MFKQRDAIIRLLQDDDPQTVNLTKRQLAQGGADTIADLRDLLTVEDQQIAWHIREVLTQIERRNARERFETLCRRAGNNFDLEEACWLLAQIFLPEVVIDRYVGQLNQWGEELKTRLTHSSSDLQAVQIFGQFFGRELGFRGNSEDYYNIRNSLLPSVIDSRLGIPISLSVLYLLVARRAGYFLEGINLPGHFVLRYHSIFFDCFYGGRVLSVRDCADILAQQKLKWNVNHLQLARPRQILIRMLANLLCIFEGTEEQALARMVKSWVQLLGPGTE
jgi:regulator of sirC expression with transglutaminase-like and TPR domain